MFIKKFMGLVVVATLLVAAGAMLANGRGASDGQEEKKELKKVPMKYIRPDSGPEMFKEYCAACHGPEGKGDGPAAEFLKSPLPNLRELAKSNNGKFPEGRVMGTLRFGTANRAHGTEEMPIWGQLFRSRDGTVSELRIHNLSDYLKSWQDK